MRFLTQDLNYDRTVYAVLVRSEMMNAYRWMKIDTASIMFSSLSTKQWGRTFRFAAVFRNNIDPELLKRAARDLMPYFPSVYSFLKQGFFWNYQQLTDSLPEIREEYSRPLLPITKRNDSLPDFRLVYYKNRLAIECSHSLGDGKGIMIYFKHLLARYDALCRGETEEYTCNISAEERSVNAFAEYYIKGGEKAKDRQKTAFRFSEKYDKDYLKLLFAMTPVIQVKQFAHAQNMSVTEYMTAVLILGVIRSSEKPISKPITVAVPVNLRRFFPTNTVRNFTVQTYVTFSPNGRRDISLKEVCRETKGQLKAQLTADELQKTLNKFGSLAANPILKAVPNVLKLPVLRSMQKKSHSCVTTIFTNYGECEFPLPLSQSVERLEFINGDTRNYGLAVTCSCISYKGILSLCFSMANKDTR